MMSKDLDFNIDDLVFMVDEDLKKDYLKQKPIQTAKSEYPTFVALDEYEALVGKPVYDFTLIERDALIMTKYNNSTLGTVNSTVSKIRVYVDFCIRQGEVVHMQNIFDTLTRHEMKKFVSKQATEFRYITNEMKEEYQNMLENYQDKLLLELPYVGIRGRTVKGGTLEEIINLQIDPKSDDVKKCKLELFRNDGTSRILTVSKKTMDLILDTYNCEEYLSDNGQFNENLRGGIRAFKINRYKNYVLCSVGNKKFDKLNSVLINSRMRKIQNYCGNSFITINNLYRSGMISMAIDIYNENGEVTRDDYIDICKRFKYGDADPEKYYLTVKEDVEMYLKGGYGNA